MQFARVTRRTSHALLWLAVFLALVATSEGQQQQQEGGPGSTIRVSPAQLLSYASSSGSEADGAQVYFLEPGLEVQVTGSVLSPAAQGFLDGPQQHVVLRGLAPGSTASPTSSINLNNYKTRKSAFVVANGAHPLPGLNSLVRNICTTACAAPAISPPVLP